MPKRELKTCWMCRRKKNDIKKEDYWKDKKLFFMIDLAKKSDSNYRPRFGYQIPDLCLVCLNFLEQIPTWYLGASSKRGELPTGLMKEIKEELSYSVRVRGLRIDFEELQGD